MKDKLNPRVDVAFKKIFGVQENKDLLISLINAVVSADDQICDVEILNPYSSQNFRYDKFSIVDVKAMGHNQKRYHIEMQISDEGDYDKRALYNWAKAYAEQIGKGDDYADLNKTIGIHILNFLSVPESHKYHNVFNLREREHGFKYFGDMEIHTIELKKFDQKQKDKKAGLLSKAEELDALMSKVKTGLDIWVAFLTRNELLDKSKLPEPVNTPAIKKALDVLESMNFSKQEREAYEAHLQWLRVETSTLFKAEEKGVAKGLVKGRAEGLVEGRAEGLLDGRRKIALRLLRENFDVQTVARMTELTRDEVALLLTELSNNEALSN